MSTPLSPGPHTVEIDGVAQRYHVAGAGPVCLVHSGGPGMAWDYLRMPAVERHLTLVYVEPIGTGGSGRLESHPHGYTRERYSRALDGLIDHLDVPEVYLLGHSHGGFVAQYYALGRADRLAGIILYESAPVTGPEHFAEAMRHMEAFTAKHTGNPELAPVLEAWQGFATLADDEGVTKVARGILPAYFADFWGRETEFLGFQAAVTGVFISGLDADLTPDQIDDREALGSVKVPTLVIVGRHDVICGVRWSEELRDLIPGAELVVLENSGHMGHVEEPDAFARAVANFVTA
jgi:proline iminopeptidase